MSYYDGDPFSNHVLNEIKCGECEQEYDEQEGEGNICPTCKDKEGEDMKVELQEKEITAYDLSVNIELEGEKYRADIHYDTYDGYEVTFLDERGVRLPYPKWASEYEGDESLGYWLESKIGGWFKWEAEESK